MCWTSFPSLRMHNLQVCAALWYVTVSLTFLSQHLGCSFIKNAGWLGWLPVKPECGHLDLVLEDFQVCLLPPPYFCAGAGSWGWSFQCVDKQWLRSNTHEGTLLTYTRRSLLTVLVNMAKKIFLEEFPTAAFNVSNNISLSLLLHLFLMSTSLFRWLSVWF